MENNNPHKKLYYHKEIVVGYTEGTVFHEHNFDIQTKGMGDSKPDCKIGNFSLNVWYRTPYGVAGKTYKSEKSMEKAVERVMKGQGYSVVRWEESKEL